MTLMLSKHQALRLAQLEHIATKDRARTTLASVELIFTDEELQAAATDSFRLAVMTFTSSDVRFPVTTSVLVPAKELATAIRSVYKTASKEDKDKGVMLVPSTDYHHQVVVAGQWPKSPEFIVIDITAASAYPSWVSMFGDSPVDGRERWIDSTLREVPVKTTLPAFYSGYMADMDKLFGSTVQMRKEMLPWQMTWIPKAQETPEKAASQPWAWCSMNREETMGISYLLMPVNQKRRSER